MLSLHSIAADCVSGSTTSLSSGNGIITVSPYSNNDLCMWSISAPNPTWVVILIVTQLDTECGWDYVHVYDGPSQTSPKLASYCGNRLARPSDVVVSSTKNLFVLFESDASETYSGFTLQYTSGTWDLFFLSVCSPLFLAFISDLLPQIPKMTGPCPINCTIPTAGGGLCSPQYCSCVFEFGELICTFGESLWPDSPSFSFLLRFYFLFSVLFYFILFKPLRTSRPLVLVILPSTIP